MHQAAVRDLVGLNGQIAIDVSTGRCKQRVDQALELVALCLDRALAECTVQHCSSQDKECRQHKGGSNQQSGAQGTHCLIVGVSSLQVSSAPGAVASPSSGINPASTEPSPSDIRYRAAL